MNPFLYILNNKIKMQSANQNLLFTIFHFNDCYDIQQNTKGKFGIVSFQSYLRKQQKKYPNNLLLFSGDCFSPSILTNIFEGKHMVTALNMLNIDVACYGNHQFDLESEKTLTLAQSCNFPWLLGNIKYRGTQFNLGDGKPYVIKEKFGMRIGIYGIGGEDWLGILNEQYQNQLSYQDVGKYSNKMVKHLKQQQNCNIIIALTHMRVYQDKKLPLQQPNIDIILGGHDHIILKQFINGIPVLKSGDNFKNLGIIHIYKKGKYQNAMYKGRDYDFDFVIDDIPGVTDVNEMNLELKKHVDASMEKYKKTDHIIGYTDVPLELRFDKIRSVETNYGNFVADLVRMYYDVDICVLNSGSFRNDIIVSAGQLRYSVLSNIINSVLVVKEVPGKTVLQMLQYSISALPGYSGGFLIVSGIRFSYNLNKSPRIQQVTINKQLLQIDKIYKLATQIYIATGGDGFNMLKQCKMIIDPIAGIDTLRLILKFFKGITEYEEPKKYLHPKEEDDQIPFPLQMLKICRRISTKTNRLTRFKRKFIINEKGAKMVCISPQTDGRIMAIQQ